MGRPWRSIEGNLFLSVLMRPATLRYPGHWSILSAVALLKVNPKPTAEEVRRALSGNLCRCGSHTRIIDAIEEAAQTMDGWASQRAPQ